MDKNVFNSKLLEERLAKLKGLKVPLSLEDMQLLLTMAIHISQIAEAAINGAIAKVDARAGDEFVAAAKDTREQYLVDLIKEMLPMAQEAYRDDLHSGMVTQERLNAKRKILEKAEAEIKFQHKLKNDVTIQQGHKGAPEDGGKS